MTYAKKSLQKIRIIEIKYLNLYKLKRERYEKH